MPGLVFGEQVNYDRVSSKPVASQSQGSIMEENEDLDVMKKLIKDLVKVLIQKLGYVAYTREAGKVTGVSFDFDLRLLIARDSPVCVDVGANLGQTIERLQKLFRLPYIYAFEPAGEVFRQLQSKNFGGRVRLFNCALGELTAQKELHSYEYSVLNSFLKLNRAKEAPFHHLELKQVEMVQMRTLDSFVKEQGISRIDFLKIDTQGYDLQVLRGARECFESGIIGVVFVEMNFMKSYEDQSKPWEIEELLSTYGYYLVDYYDKERRSQTLIEVNALFVKR